MSMYLAPSPQVNEYHSRVEATKITEYFAADITEKKTPSLSQCEEFLKMHADIHRSKKQIQDKVKTIVKGH